MSYFKISTFGCKVNQYETQAMRESLLASGYEEVTDGQKADLYFVNTCTVTGKADRECRETLRRFLRENLQARVFACGCYTEKDADILRAIDDRIEILSNSQKQNIINIVRGDGTRDAICHMPYAISHFKGHTKAFIKIQDGCDNFCSYCKVPFVRGRSRSRDFQEIVEEAKRLIDNGYKELVLTGICLGNFGKDSGDDINLASLVREICNIDGDFRIRLSSIEFEDITDGLIDEISLLNKLCNHLHIPLQSGDDHILSKMNRRYKAGDFIKRVNEIRMKIPDIAITTDVIVGFPDESDENFNNTLDTFKRLKPSRTHIFTYSPRKGTKAFDMKDSIPRQTKSLRSIQIRELADKFAKEFLMGSSSSRHRVLIESSRDKRNGLLTGYTDTYIKVFFDADDNLMNNFLSDCSISKDSIVSLS
ncbi:tRNA (N(6)-L-threonylcarbamoyladenosine(37)-C(2))-methylthiotransferase MtaB [Candidatus Omnitrophota bacterium]